MGRHHSGDSDSTGAIAGNLLGALHGVDAIPERWLSPLELKGVISDVGNDLFDFMAWDVDGGGGRRIYRTNLQEVPALLED